MTEVVMHRLMVRRGDITAVRERIERVLGVKTTIHPVPAEYGGGWDLDFSAPQNVDLDFLRPDVLPPLAWSPPPVEYKRTPERWEIHK